MVVDTPSNRGRAAVSSDASPITSVRIASAESPAETSRTSAATVAIAPTMISSGCTPLLWMGPHALTRDALKIAPKADSP